VPCYNEQHTILTLLKHVADSPWVREIIVVDDGSTDNTRQILAGIDDPTVRVVLHERNKGKGAALRTGFRQATSEFVIVQDADLEYDPNEFGDLLPPVLDDKADVVFGSRFLSGRPHRVLYFWHSMGNRMLTLASNMFTGLNLSDMETCYKLFRREVLESITIEEDRFGFEPEITAKVAKAVGGSTRWASRTTGAHTPTARRSAAGRGSRSIASSATRGSATAFVVVADAGSRAAPRRRHSMRRSGSARRPRRTRALEELLRLDPRTDRPAHQRSHSRSRRRPQHVLDLLCRPRTSHGSSRPDRAWRCVND
jgi:hypothetical protein